MMVTIDDVINAGLCGTGFVRWAKARGIPRRDIMRMLDQGISLDELDKIDDPLADTVREYMKQKANRNG